MKILLDENLPRKLAVDFGGEHEVFTVGNMQWNGKKNGELLGLMTLYGFDALLTIDKNLKHQQNIDRFPIRLLILDAPNNKIETLKPYIEKLNARLKEGIANKVVEITI